MTSNFDLAKSIYLSKEDMINLLAQLKPTKFAFTILHTLVGIVAAAASTNRSNNIGGTKMGIVTGVTSLSSSTQNNNSNNNNSNITSLLIESHLRGSSNESSSSSSLIAEADVALVVDFGDTKETVRLASLQQRSVPITQHDHGLFIQRFSVSSNMMGSNRTHLPEAEEIVEIRNRINQGFFHLHHQQQGSAGNNNNKNSSTNNNNSNTTNEEVVNFATWKILDATALKNKLAHQQEKMGGARRDREEELDQSKIENDVILSKKTRKIS